MPLPMTWIFFGCMLRGLKFANSQACNKTMHFKFNFKNKALINHTFITHRAHDDEMCQALCFMDDRCISCTFDAQMLLCNLSNSDHIMHPEHLRDAPNAIFWSAENTCDCVTANMLSCKYNLFGVNTYDCYCKLGFGGSKCNEDLHLAAVYPLNARFQAKAVQLDAPQGSPSNVQCSDDSESPTGGSCTFKGTSYSFIHIPNANGGKLDLEESFTLLAYISAERSGPIVNFHENAWGMHWWIVGQEPISLFGRVVYRNSVFADSISTPIPKSQWLFVGFSYDKNAGVASLLIDGNLRKSLQIKSSNIATQFNVRIGARRGDARYFKGKIACLQMYGKALGKNDVKQAQHACDKFV